LIDVCGNLLEERSFPAPRKKQMPEEIVAKLRPVVTTHPLATGFDL
jgi:hypothetical protein